MPKLGDSFKELTLEEFQKQNKLVNQFGLKARVSHIDTVKGQRVFSGEWVKL